MTFCMYRWMKLFSARGLMQRMYGSQNHTTSKTFALESKNLASNWKMQEVEGSLNYTPTMTFLRKLNDFVLIR